MRILILSILIVLFSVACKTTKVITVTDITVDTVQFVYQYSEGLKFKMLGNPEKSKSLFLKCLKINNNSSASAFQLSEIYFNEQNFDSAKYYAEFCLQKDKSNEWYLLNRAKIALKLSEAETYNSIYKQLAGLYPNNIEYSFELAVIYFNNNEYDQSLNVLHQIDELIGVDENVSFLRNNIYYKQKRLDGIQGELLKLKVFYPDSVKYMDMLADFYLNTNQQDKAFNIYKNIIEIDESNIQSIYGLAVLYAKAKRFKEGYNYLVKIFGNEEIETTKKESAAQFYLDAPAGSLSDEQIDNIYIALISEEDINLEIINDYLDYLFKLKQLTETEKISKFSIKNRPDNYWGWDFLFKIYLVQSRFDELNTYSTKALEYFPNHSQVYFYVGYSYFMLKKLNEAITYFELGLDYNVDNKYLELQFYLYLAESYHSVGKNKKSDEFFELYIKKDLSNAYLLNNYAFYLVSRNTNIDRAEEISMKSIEIEPFNSTFLDTYSWILYNKSDFVNALNYIERSYKYGGNKNSIIIEHYGDILLKLGRANEAVEKWEEAYSLNKNNVNILKKIKENTNNN